MTTGWVVVCGVPVAFDRFTRHDVTDMWRWLPTGDVELDPGPTRHLYPAALTVRQWLEKGRDLGKG